MLAVIGNCLQYPSQVLFAGDMRMNLDPLEQYKDEAVWSALEQVTHTDPLFDKRYCPVNSSSRPEQEM